MKLNKLIENVHKGTLYDGTKIRIMGSGTSITYRCDLARNKRWFEKDGQRIDIMDYFGCEFEPAIKIKNNTSDIWDEFDKSLNPDDNGEHMVRNVSASTILTDEISPELAKIFLSNATDIAKSQDGYEFMLGNNNSGKYLLDNDGELKFIPFTKEESINYSHNDYLPTHRFIIAQGYFDAAVTLMNDYKKDGYEVYNIGDIKKGDTSFGNYRDALIKTLLALSCECYLQALLIFSGARFNKNHNLSELYSCLDDELIAKIFEDMERNGYDIVKYQSPHLKYDANPDLAEKFMLELARDSYAVINARYYDSDDVNIDYNFLYRFASSLRNIAMQNEKLNPYINKGNQR